MFESSRPIGACYWQLTLKLAPVVKGNTRFEVGTAKNYPEKDFDLVTFFDCLHDMGDPAGAAGHVRQSLKPDGSWMIIEPIAGDRLELLRCLDDGVHTDLAIAGGRRSTWSASR
jgi:hypothetical protein